jgi:Zn-dependent peptidase ImmA (M78 family)
VIGVELAPTKYDPYDHADRLGLRVIHHEIAPGENGRWYQHSRLVVLRPGMPASFERCVLAHEIGHAHYDHTSSTRQTEVAADLFAARRLMPRPRALFALADAYGEDSLCRAFGVTPRIFRTRMLALGLLAVGDVSALY